MGGRITWRSASGLVSWSLAAIAIAVYLHRFDGVIVCTECVDVVQWDGLVSTLGRVSTHWPLALMSAVLLLIVAGQVGADLGVPLLFRDESIAWGRKSRMFWGSLGATLMFGEFWAIIYILQFSTFYEFYPLQGQVRPGSLDWATFVRDEESVKLADLRFLDWRTMLRFMGVGGPPVLLLLVLAAALPAPVPGMGPRPPKRVAADVGNCLLGIALGVLTIFGVVVVENVLRDQADLTGLALPFGWLFRAGDLEPATVGSALMLLTLLFVAIFVLFGLGIASPLGRKIDPSLGITFTLSLVGIGYLLLASMEPAYQPVVVVGLAVYLIFSNGEPYKYRFPGMGRGDDGRSIYDRANLVSLKGLLPDSRAAGPAVGLQDDREALEAWAARWRREWPDRGPPKLVLVAMSGGAYRSGYWTGMVLDELARRGARGGPLEGVADGIRLLTGASGGMVGAGYFAVLRAEKRPGEPDASVVGEMTRDTGRDSLRPIVQQLIRRDMPLIAVPMAHQAEDRGTVLDRQWTRMDRPLAGLGQAEKEGRCPSLIISPMIVESGRRMLISNLDLEHLAEIWSDSGRFFSRSAIQFFRLFPSARPEFKLSTAVRMSATFPYASPAVNLPTKPPRRLVDAGYYDNYGVNLSANWAYHHRDWIEKNTSGVALIQIHAYSTEEVKKTATPSPDVASAEGSRAKGSLTPSDRPRTTSARLFARLAASFSWLTTPGEGALSARGWTMSFRNDEQVRMLDDHFNGIEPGLFETFVFENPVAFGLNWFLSERDVAEMARQIQVGPNLDELDRLAAWWNRPRGDGRA